MTTDDEWEIAPSQRQVQVQEEKMALQDNTLWNALHEMYEIYLLVPVTLYLSRIVYGIVPESLPFFVEQPTRISRNEFLRRAEQCCGLVFAPKLIENTQKTIEIDLQL